MVDGKRYLAHRLAWLYMTGEWPSKELDHEDRNRSNNRWLNIRVATKKQNGENRKLHKNSQTGVRGVSWDAKLQKFRARIFHNGKPRFLGLHGTIIDAVAARLNAERALFSHAPSTVN